MLGKRRPRSHKKLIAMAYYHNFELPGVQNHVFTIKLSNAVYIVYFRERKLYYWAMTTAQKHTLLDTISENIFVERQNEIIYHQVPPKFFQGYFMWLIHKMTNLNDL